MFESALERGHFTPNEEQRLVGWFARFLTVRDSLWEVIDEASLPIGDDFEKVIGQEQWRCFLAGYAAACLVVQLDRALVDRIAVDTRVQRKLNEGSLEHRIPRKQFTRIFRSLSNPGGALRLHRAMRYRRRHHELVVAMVEDRVVGPIVRRLEEYERSLDSSRSRFLKILGAFESHSARRRGASLRQQVVAATLERSGRVASELRVRKPKRVLAEVERIRDLLAPGDVLVTRHEAALTNLFLPGYWPHAALYVGSTAERQSLGLGEDSLGEIPIAPGQSVLEALKDGVLFRELESTLAVDAVAVIRPKLSKHQIAQALQRAAIHEGKLYNFDFDFFRSDRLVCTEVVYRAFDGLGPMQFELKERSGRPTLSAEDLLDLALEGDRFEVVAVMGTADSTEELITGRNSRTVLERSYRG